MDRNLNRCPDCRVRGNCCYISVIDPNGDVIGLRALPCRHLDDNNMCRVYKDRLNHGCLTIEAGIKAGVLPDDCQYVKDLKEYKGKRFANRDYELRLIQCLIMDSDPDKMLEIYPDEFKKIIREYHDRTT